MITTLVFVFAVWLPVATTLQAVVQGVESKEFTSKWKQILYVTLAAPALYANWLTAVAVRNQSTIDRLNRIGDWFKA